MEGAASTDCRRLVVVGASLAGVRAVQAARRSGFDGHVTLVGAEPHLPYDRPPLSKAFLTEDADVTYYLTEEELRHGLDVDLRLGCRATALDPTARVVLSAAGPLPYDRLVIATGAQARTLGNGPALQGVATLRTLGDALSLRASLRTARDVVIIGAGFIGSEVASSARECGARVSILDAADVPLVRAFGPQVGRAVAGLHERYGTRLICGVQAEGLVGQARVEGVRLSSGETLPADLVVVGVGAVPATGWLRTSGISLHPMDGGVVCDEYLESSLPGVYAAGDVAHWPNAMFDEAVRLENWTNAADQAARATINALVPDQRRAHETVPYVWSDWYGHRLQFVGTPEADDVVFAVGGADEEHFVALYRRGDRLVGVATLDAPRAVMRYRRFIGSRGRFADAAHILPPKFADTTPAPA